MVLGLIRADHPTGMNIPLLLPKTWRSVGGSLCIRVFHSHLLCTNIISNLPLVTLGIYNLRLLLTFRSTILIESIM